MLFLRCGDKECRVEERRGEETRKVLETWRGSGISGEETRKGEEKRKSKEEISRAKEEEMKQIEEKKGEET